MGVVYEGFDPLIGRRVALKTVRRDQLERAEAQEILNRFLREAQAAGRLSHPNIVQVYEYGEDQGTAFIAMEFVEGRDLKDYFDRDERFPLPEIVRIMTQLLGALDYSHSHGVVHRDIKPSNIFILRDGTVKVGDFGIARLESSNLTQAGSMLGTPAYMSPEQFMGQTVDGRSDLFSAGVVLYQFLTGEKPFTGALTTIMHKVLKEEPPPPSELNVQVPRPFDGLIRKALAKRPDERFQTGSEFAQALQLAASGQRTDAEATIVDASATADSTVAMAGGSTAATPAPAVPSRPAGSGRSSTVLALAILGGLFLVGIGLAAYVFLGRSKTQEAPTTAPPVARQAEPAAQPAVAVAKPPAPPAPPSQPEAAPPADTMVISALGLADPSDPRYQQDKALINADLREDAKRQLVEKAVALYVDQGSLSKNYGVLRDKLLSRSGEFIQNVIEEQPPQLGRDGLLYQTTRATVKVRDVQRSLNEMSRQERIDFIRNNGDPKISVQVAMLGADAPPGTPPQRSPVAENLLKERIQSFGFRVWNDEAARSKGGAGADFAIDGEAKFKKLSARLPASGVTIEKFVLTSWTVRATDKQTGEEIYYNTTIPEKTSWNSEEAALRDIGRLIGEEFSRSFFLQHFHFSGQRVRLNIAGLPDAGTVGAIMRELAGLRTVLGANLAQAGSGHATIDVDLSGGAASATDLVQGTILAPLNRKLGKQCLSVAGGTAAEVSLRFEAACGDPAVLSRLDSLPPAALFDAPQPRRDAVVKNPQLLDKLRI
jgi:serine/threonine-protein kinase